MAKLYLATCAVSDVFRLSTAWAHESEEGVAAKNGRDQFSSGTFLGTLYKSPYYLTIHEVVFMKYGKALHGSGTE